MEKGLNKVKKALDIMGIKKDKQNTFLQFLVSSVVILAIVIYLKLEIIFVLVGIFIAFIVIYYSKELKKLLL